jgi:hypothetical protein
MQGSGGGGAGRGGARPCRRRRASRRTAARAGRPPPPRSPGRRTCSRPAAGPQLAFGAPRPGAQPHCLPPSSACLCARCGIVLSVLSACALLLCARCAISLLPLLCARSAISLRPLLCARSAISLLPLLCARCAISLLPLRQELLRRCDAVGMLLPLRRCGAVRMRGARAGARRAPYRAEVARPPLLAAPVARRLLPRARTFHRSAPKRCD